MKKEAERIYYWEHPTDESRCFRSDSPRDVAEIAHAQGGEVGVIIDSGGPLDIIPVAMLSTISETAAALRGTIG